MIALGILIFLMGMATGAAIMWAADPEQVEMRVEAVDGYKRVDVTDYEAGGYSAGRESYPPMPKKIPPPPSPPPSKRVNASSSEASL